MKKIYKVVKIKKKEERGLGIGDFLNKWDLKVSAVSVDKERNTVIIQLGIVGTLLSLVKGFCILRENMLKELQFSNICRKIYLVTIYIKKKRRREKKNKK